MTAIHARYHARIDSIPLGQGPAGVAVIRDGGAPVTIPGALSTRELAQRACRASSTLAAIVEASQPGAPLDLAAVELLAPIDHADPAHLLLSGTGLTHLGSAEERDRMHRAVSDVRRQSDSMKMFLMGVEGGKPAPGTRACSPNGSTKATVPAWSPPAAPLCLAGFRPRCAARNRRLPAST